MEVAIHACLDIADHIVAKLGFELPKKDRKETFAILSKHSIIPDTLVIPLTAVAGQRNILVHEYLEVERDMIYDTINTHLGDIEAYVSAIHGYIKEKF